MRRLQGIITRPGLQQGVALVIATTLAYGLDYLFNLLAGRLLEPADFGIVVSLAAAVQVMVVASRVIQTVTTRYVSRYEAGKKAQQGSPGVFGVKAADQTRAFFRAAFRSAWWWGLAATVILVLVTPLLADFFQIESLGPVLAIAVTTVFFALRPVVGGVLQGEQRFAALGSVQIVQAVLRLGIGVLLISLGLGAFGAMAALPLAVAGTLIYALFLLDRRMLRPGKTAHDVSLPDLFRYSAYTAAGLIGFAVLVNMDAILVKRFFDPTVAGNYGTAVTLGKIVQFFPLTIILILFPKAAQRKASRRDTGGILLVSMLIVGAVGAVLTTLYFLFSDFIIGTIFGPAYNLESEVLGMVGLGMGFLSLVNVWLNFYLSIERTSFVYLIWIGVFVQLLLMILFHEALWHLPFVVTINGLWMTGTGIIIYFNNRSKINDTTINY